MTARLDVRGQRRRIDAARSGHRDTRAVLRAALDVLTPGDGDDRDRYGAVLRPDRKAVRVEERDRSEVRVLEAIGAYDLERSVRKLVDGIRQRDLVFLRRGRQPVHV